METKNMFFRGNIYLSAIADMDQISESAFDEYLTQLTHYPYIGEPLKDGQEVIESVDYTLQYEVNNCEKDEWKIVTQQQYINTPRIHNFHRIVAIGIPKATDNEIVATITADKNMPESLKDALGKALNLLHEHLEKTEEKKVDHLEIWLKAKELTPVQFRDYLNRYYILKTK